MDDATIDAFVQQYGRRVESESSLAFGGGGVRLKRALGSGTEVGRGGS